VPIESEEYEGMFHVFQILMPWAEASRESFRSLRGFIHKILNAAPPLAADEIGCLLRAQP
jgi:epsilon-lactone hydrolase